MRNFLLTMGVLMGLFGTMSGWLFADDAPAAGWPEPRVLLPVQVDGLWGAIGVDGELVIPAAHTALALNALPIWEAWPQERDLLNPPSPDSGWLLSAQRQWMAEGGQVYDGTPYDGKPQLAVTWVVGQDEQGVVLYDCTGALLARAAGTFEPWELGRGIYSTAERTWAMTPAGPRHIRLAAGQRLQHLHRSGAMIVTRAGKDTALLAPDGTVLASSLQMTPNGPATILYTDAIDSPLNVMDLTGTRVTDFPGMEPALFGLDHFMDWGVYCEPEGDLWLVNLRNGAAAVVATGVDPRPLGSLLDDETATDDEWGMTLGFETTPGWSWGPPFGQGFAQVVLMTGHVGVRQGDRLTIYDDELRRVHGHDLPARHTVYATPVGYILREVDGEAPDSLHLLDGTLLRRGHFAPRADTYAVMAWTTPEGQGLLAADGRILVAPRPEITGSYPDRDEGYVLMLADDSREEVGLDGQPHKPPYIAAEHSGLGVQLNIVQSDAGIELRRENGELQATYDGATRLWPSGVGAWMIYAQQIELPADDVPTPKQGARKSAAEAVFDLFGDADAPTLETRYYLHNLRSGRLIDDADYSTIVGRGDRFLYLRTKDDRTGYLRADGTWLWEPRK